MFVHAQPCGGYDERAGLPSELRTGPRVLRGYRHDGAMAYDAIRVVDPDVDIEGALADLLALAHVAEVHVRAADAQCFTYLVRPGDGETG